MKGSEKNMWMRRITLMLTDICVVILASVGALLVRFEFGKEPIPDFYINVIWEMLPLIIPVAIAIFSFFRLYSTLWYYAGSTELLYLTSACVVDAVMNTVMVLLVYRHEEYPLPRSWYFIYGALLLIMMVIARFSQRGMKNLSNRKLRTEKMKRVLIVGAGEAGNAIIKEIVNSPYVNLKIVGIVDDDKGKRGKFMHGIKVIGDRNDIVDIAESHRVDEIIIAMPTVSAMEMKGILDICKQTGCELKRLPGMYQLVNGDVSISKLKDVDVNDLLGREPIKVDLDSIMGYVSGKVVMVTGGGGSIGSELCRQVASHNPTAGDCRYL